MTDDPWFATNVVVPLVIAAVATLAALPVLIGSRRARAGGAPGERYDEDASLREAVRKLEGPVADLERQQGGGAAGRPGVAAAPAPMLGE